ncbi:MAG: hypothetical protein KME22_20995 [Hassallia sp. WJT32-NPBG1]|nr:hypothetical protein [Hassallia sp. WJT32-NPBG1]
MGQPTTTFTRFRQLFLAKVHAGIGCDRTQPRYDWLFLLNIPSTKPLGGFLLALVFLQFTKVWCFSNQGWNFGNDRLNVAKDSFYIPSGKRYGLFQLPQPSYNHAIALP